jgi:hypothetical protein
MTFSHSNILLHTFLNNFSSKKQVFQHFQQKIFNTVMTLCVRHVEKISTFTDKSIIKKLCGFGLLANHADRATAASWRSSTNFCG